MMPFIFRSHRALRGAFSNNAAGWRGRKKKGCSTLIFAHWRGQLYGRSESSEKVTGFSEISFFYLSPLPGLCVCLWIGARNKSWFWFTSNINLRVNLKSLGLGLGVWMGLARVLSGLIAVWLPFVIKPVYLKASYCRLDLVRCPWLSCCFPLAGCRGQW